MPQILAGDDPSLSSRRDRPSTHGAGAAARSTSRQRNPSASSTSSGLSLAVLLKLLSDSSERVLRYDLQLLAQISSLGSGPSAGAGAGGRGTAAGPGGDDEYFAPLMSSLLELFSTDRKLLETRGSLIIRQLCGSLNAERIYRTCAEILEKDEVRLPSLSLLTSLPRSNTMLTCFLFDRRTSSLRASWSRTSTSS